MPFRPVFTIIALTVALTAAAVPFSAHAADEMATCADARVKTQMLDAAALAAAETACSHVLAAATNDTDRQKAAFYRGLMRFLQVIQQGTAKLSGRGGVPSYTPPGAEQVGSALADIETAISLDGPMKGDALTLRTTINQTLGRHDRAQSDIDQAMRVAPQNATPLVQRALEQERAGHAAAALADLDRAVAVDPAAGTALSMRGNLLRRLGLLIRAKADFTAAAALGPPFRRLALIRNSEVELRAGDLQAAHDDLLAAARERGDMSDAEAAAANAELMVRAGDLALDKLKDARLAAAHFQAASQLAPGNWSAQLGLARVAEQNDDRAGAAAIYRRILTATETTPRLLERMLAAFRLKQLAEPERRSDLGPFRSAFEIGVTAGSGSPDGLKRVAFVIGQGDYGRLASLPNARRDAAVMANALAEMGFDTVEIAENLDAASLRRTPTLIAEHAAKADVVLVFYAGHGVEAAGVNYLIPIDAAPESDRDLANGALALADLTAAAGKARRGALVIVDACRDDPFVEARAAAASRRTAAQPAMAPPQLHSGLARMPTVAPNSVVFHSTQPGQAALDGEGLDSPFVRALLETLATPNQPFRTVVEATTTRVSATTQGRQLPAAYGTAPAIALLPPALAR